MQFFCNLMIAYWYLFFVATSRKDDMIAICYLLVFLVTGSLPWASMTRIKDKEAAFRNVNSSKMEFQSRLQASNGDYSSSKYFACQIGC